jgi:hypothetical protein
MRVAADGADVADADVGHVPRDRREHGATRPHEPREHGAGLVGGGGAMELERT